MSIHAHRKHSVPQFLTVFLQKIINQAAFLYTRDGVGCIRHLHDFEVNHFIEHGKQHMGIPDDDGFDDIFNTLPSWDYSVRDYLVPRLVNTIS